MRDGHTHKTLLYGRVELAVLLVGLLAGCDRRAAPQDLVSSSTAPESSQTVEAISATQTLPNPTALAAKPTEVRSPEYQRGYEEGVTLAELEIKSNKATIYVLGMRALGDGLDNQTGLNNTSIADCMVNDTIKGRANGHNSAVREFIAKYGLPAYSRKKWESDLFAQSAYFSTRAADDVERLRIGGRDIALGNGRYRLKASPNGLHAYVDGTQLVKHYVTGEIRTTLDPSFAGDQERTEVTLGPEGSDTIFFRWTSRDKKQIFGVLDMRNGEWIRKESN